LGVTEGTVMQTIRNRGGYQKIINNLQSKLFHVKKYNWVVSLVWTITQNNRITLSSRRGSLSFLSLALLLRRELPPSRLPPF
jgi:hypothetical protein